MLERYIKRPFFLEKTLNFFHIRVKKLKNQVRNEIFRQMSLTLTLALGVPVRPMDAKGLTLLSVLGHKNVTNFSQPMSVFLKF